MKPILTKRPEILKELGSHLLQTLDGFIFVLSADGKVKDKIIVDLDFFPEIFILILSISYVIETKL